MTSDSSARKIGRSNFDAFASPIRYSVELAASSRSAVISQPCAERATRVNRYARSSACAVASIELRVRSACASNARTASYAERASRWSCAGPAPGDQALQRRVECPRRPARRPCHDLLDRRRPSVPPRTAAVPAAARRRSPRSPHPRRRADRVHPPPPAAKRPRARHPRFRLRATVTTCGRGTPESSKGSNTNASPSWRRRAKVAASRSVLIDEATAGPCHSSSAGIASPADFPDCGGPNATSACRCSARSRRPPLVSQGQPARWPAGPATPRLTQDRQLAPRRPARAAHRHRRCPEPSRANANSTSASASATERHELSEHRSASPCRYWSAAARSASGSAGRRRNASRRATAPARSQLREQPRLRDSRARAALASVAIWLSSWW